MGLPLVPILSALTPVVLGAFDLYRQRREAREANSGAPSQAEGMRTPDVLAKRMDELEASDVEQARLISQLSNTVEALAKTLQQEIEAGRRRDVQLRQRLWIAYGVAGMSALLALWVGFR